MIHTYHLEVGYISGIGGGWRWKWRHHRMRASYSSFREFGLDLWLGAVNINLEVSKV